MTFKKDFLKSLRSGAKHDTLMDVVRQHQSEFPQGDQVYAALEQIWAELGFASAADDTPIRHELEFVMERLWFNSPADRH